MSCRPVTAWLFGKLPSHGDFVSRGLSVKRRDRFDLWLSDEMIQSREHYGHTFEAAFDAAPPWRFANEDNIDGWEGGALCASIDAAGRRFPLIVGRTASDAIDAFRAANACETAIYCAFSDQLSVDELWHTAATTPSSMSDETPLSGWWTDGNDAFPARHFIETTPVGLIATMLEARSDG